MRYFVLFLSIIFLIPQVHAEEVYCSLNDGIKADGKTVLEHQGAKHHFCCSGCLDQFKANPEKFGQQIRQPALTNSTDAEAACSSVCSG